ncbi:MAG: hypothetical protein J6Z11_15405, partial [Candidatus Riflebacteria bacterium]|nr:hypothetical protein [Candidatus Riflebacteria bacterium]
INCYSDIEVIGDHNIVGGLVGTAGDSFIENSYSLGNITGPNDVGGIAGLLINSNLRNCFSKSIVTSTNKYGWYDNLGIGGLVGRSSNSTINSCYFSGELISDEGLYGNQISYSVGGIAGYLENSTTIINCYALFDINGYKDNIGGILGKDISDRYINKENNIVNCYAGCSNLKSQSDKIYRIVGYPDQDTAITNCYANKNMKLIKNGVTTQPGLQNPLPATVALDGADGANLPDNPDWKNKIFKDGYENGESFDSVWEIGTSGLPILKNMPGNPVQ